MVDLTNQLAPQPKRVLHVIQRMRPGGVQTAVMNLYRQFDRTQIQFDFAVRSHQPEYYDEEIKALGGQLFHLPWSNGNPLSLIAYKQALANLLHEAGPYIAIHSHAGLYSGHILPIASQANIPLRLAHSHSASSDKLSPLRSLWAKFMRQSIRHNATHLLTCSALAANWLYGRQWDKDSRVTKFPNAIDMSQYASLDNDRLKWRKITGLPSKGPLIGHIGRFDTVKNHAFLLKLFAAFHQTNPDARLILVGEGILKHQIKAQAEALGLNKAVIFLGARNDVPCILGALDLFVLPSLHEGFGIVLVEAQAAGTPCLASDVVSPEVDVGLGIVHFLPLSSDVNTWVQETKASLMTNPVTWKIRSQALQNAGYDIQNSVKLLKSLYLSAEYRQTL